MLVRLFVLALSIAAPGLAHSQASDSTRAQHRRNVFSVQPWTDNAPGPRLELERGVTDRLSLVLGSRLTLRNRAFVGRSPAFTELDLGVRYYAGGQTFRGPFAGLYAGYDRALRGYGVGTRYQVPRAFLGATVGSDFVVFRRLIIGPALGIEYGRPDPFRGVRTWQLAPRLGFGINFE
jgi:hypothetical protein